MTHQHAEPLSDLRRVTAAAVAQPLLAWYDVHRRPLPWRDHPTPYAVWVSEIMAQQTRIAQLLPFYARFMERFPTVEALAEAELEAVLAVWAGMGYYARARHLHDAARCIQHERAGRLPETCADWQALPGVGAYTAAAIMSIAYGARAAAVDGNALRVYARLTDDVVDISQPQAKALAEAFLLCAMPETAHAISRFTQAVMELGALVCVPGCPLCASCPLTDICLAYQTGHTAVLPVKSPKKQAVSVDMTVALVIDPSGRVLTRTRSESLLRGMRAYCVFEEVLDAEQVSALIQGWGYTVVGTEPLGRATHTFTHRVWRMDGFAVFVNETTAYGDYTFTTYEALETGALPAALRYYTAWYRAFHLSANRLSCH